MKLPENPTQKVRAIIATVLQCPGCELDEKDLYEIKKLCDCLDTTLSTMKLHAGDCCSLNNEVELFRGHWEDAEERCKELTRENKHLKIWLDQYEADAAELIEEHGADPDDKIDREVLKRMLNYLIGENRRLKND
jgi:hypothetical protein